MQVQQTTNQNFGARLIRPATIRIKNDKGKWINDTVSFIKFDTTKKADVQALEKLAYHWDDVNLSSGVAEEARILRGKAEVYALTNQKDDFKNINPKDILGVMTTDKTKNAKGNVEVFKIGTDPTFAYEQNRRKRSVKHIAKAMVNEFVRLVNKNKQVEAVVVYSEPNEEKFLSKVGFKKLDDTLAPKFAIEREQFSQMI